MGKSDVVLYGVSRFDPLAVMGGLAFLLIAVTIAARLPARRAASIDPALTLRAE